MTALIIFAVLGMIGFVYVVVNEDCNK